MFYDRFVAACNVRNIAPTTAIREIGSSGMKKSWQEGGRPRADIVVKAALYLRVTTDYLLEISDVMNPVINEVNGIDLSAEEDMMIHGLRAADPIARDHVLKMAAALLPSSEPKLDSAVFSSSVDRISYHEKSNRRIQSPRHVDHLKRVEGNAAAGAPITAASFEGETVSVPKKYLDERFFIVRAQGVSMEPRIHDASYCVFNSDAAWDAGDVVFVRVEGATDQSDVLIKRIYPCGDKVRLESINPAVAPMFFPAADVSVGGVFIDTL